MPKFLTRKRGTSKQIGKAFPLLEKKKLPPKIKITRTARSHVPKFQWVNVELTESQLKGATEIQFKDLPKDVVERIQPFLDTQFKDPESVQFFKGYYKGAPFYHIADPFSVGTLVRKQVPRTQEEVRLMKKHRKKEREEIAKERLQKEIVNKLKAKKQTAVQALALAKRMPFMRKEDIAVLQRMSDKEKVKAIKKMLKTQKPDPAYVQYMKDMGIRKQIAKKVRDVKYPASSRGPSYQRYLAKLREKRKLAKAKR